jgi:hypothetical protein
MENLTKEKFEIFMMLCASGIDGNISMNELERICMQFDEKSYNEVFESWKSMTSPAWLSFFKEHKDEFLKTEEDANALMLQVHHSDKAVVGIYSYDIAVSKARKATNMAREQGYPLRLTVEPEQE